VRIINFKELNSRKGITYSRDHLRRKCAAGEFPQPIPISSRFIAWVEDEVDQWLEGRVAARAERLNPTRSSATDTELGVIGNGKLAETDKPAAPAPRSDAAAPRRRVRPPGARDRQPRNSRKVAAE
jgi:prophage regulatory protein